jgi:glycosyltransferase involved in cell wall biosynthesis
MTIRASVLFLAYNHHAFVADALKSALMQDCGDFELIIVDDASTDGTRQVVEDTLRLHDRPDVSVRRIYHDRNQGLLAAVNSAMAVAKGDCFVMMAGDDISMTYRLRLTLEAFNDPDVMLVVGDYQKINAKGNPYPSRPSRALPRRCGYGAVPSFRIYGNSCPFGAAAAYRRKLYDFFGPMRPGSHAEDNCFWVRALLLGQIHHEATQFVLWRQHDKNISNFRVSLESDIWRRRHLDWMDQHSRMSPQWLVDIDVAHEAGVIPAFLRSCLRIAARREDATWGLEASSLRQDAWSLWLHRAWKMIALGRVSTAFRMFKLRVSRRRQEKRWKSWADLKLDTTA